MQRVLINLQQGLDAGREEWEEGAGKGVRLNKRRSEGEGEASDLFRVHSYVQLNMQLRPKAGWPAKYCCIPQLHGNQ